MNAYELANTILKTTDMQVYAQSVTKATNMLRQQADRIAELEKQGFTFTEDGKFIPPKDYVAQAQTKPAPEGLIDPKSYYIGYEDGKKAPQTKPLEKTDAYSLAIKAGFMLSTQHGQGENKLMPVTDGDTLMALVKVIEERHGIK